MPIIIRKPKASMTMVGFLLMKLASGSAASSMTATATSTAMTMIGICSVMPTAVMMLSIENTRSSIRICPIAAVKVMLPALLSNISGPGSGSTLWWISLVAFHTRNRPPAIRIRSRHEKP